MKINNKVKDIDIKKHTYYFFNDIINIKNFDPSIIKIDEKSYRDILIYYTGYVTIRDSKFEKNYSGILLYLIFCKGNGYFEEINGNMYFTLFPTNVRKEKLKNIKNCGLKSEI